ncbi:hypothetical protein [Paenibacillus turpanensis]|uniref:hypothetical protein n=1 Tax=Paenibacillus turpanensis TaxID=2689078 RepID=UPI0014076457|nr:hypothetical protein [Paenibacillus turpanensis]
MTRVMTESRKDPVQERKQKNNFNKLPRLFAGTGMITAALGWSEKLYASICSTFAKKDEFLSLEEQQRKKKISELAREWHSKPDELFWNDLANYVSDQNNKTDLTIHDQIRFMNFTIELVPEEVWIWDKAKHKADMVARFIQLYKDGGMRTEAMYRCVSLEKYGDKTMPRHVAADVLRYALTEILILIE